MFLIRSMIMLLLLQKYFYYLCGSKLTKYCPLFEFFNYVLGHFSPECTKQKQLAQISRMSCVETKAQAFPEKKSKKNIGSQLLLFRTIRSN